MILLESDFEIRDSKRLLKAVRLPKNKAKLWMPLINVHPHLFTVTSYRKRLVIERLIGELDLMNTEWIHRIVDQQKRNNKPMLRWMVEDRNLSQLYDHYRVFMSFKVQSSPLLPRRWLKFTKKTTMSGKTGFDDSDETCYQATTYEADGERIAPTTLFVMPTVRQITAKNAKLFGKAHVVLHEFGKSSENQPASTDFVDALKVDQYSNGCIFVDDIPSKTHRLSVGDKVRLDDINGEITRMNDNEIFIKTKSDNTKMYAFRWMLKSQALEQITLGFQNEESIKNFEFAAKNEGDEWSKFSALKSHQFPESNQFLMPRTGLSSFEADTTVIGIYAKPKQAEYEWVQIKTIEYQLINGSFSTPKIHQELQDDQNMKSITDRLVMTLLSSNFEIRDSGHALNSLGLQFDEHSEWLSLVALHGSLFDITVYRRKLVIERLIVELKLWCTDWIHRILEQKMKGKPMLQWLVEDRRVSQLYKFYVVYMSRFKEKYCALLDRRWLRFVQRTTMRDKPGFDGPTNSYFRDIVYEADGKAISHRTPVLTASVRQITVSNDNLFGNRPVILQEFDRTNADDYNVREFLDALRYDGEFVFLNHIPSASYPFEFGQEVQHVDGSIGIVTRITVRNICVKFIDKGSMIFFRWFERWQIPMELTLRFRHKEELNHFTFALSAAKRAKKQKLSEQYFSEIEKFEIPRTSSNAPVGSGDPVIIHAKPRNGDYKWVYIKSLYPPTNSDAGSLYTLHNGDHEIPNKVIQFLLWLRQRESKIMDNAGILEQFGLTLDHRTQWMPLMVAHPVLFAITAYRRTLLVERLIVEFDLLSFEMVHRIIEQRIKNKPMLNWLVEDRKVRELYNHYVAMTSSFKKVFYSDLFDRTWLKFERNTKLKETDEFKGADDSCFEKTEYLINGGVYHSSGTTICVKGGVRQVCRNHELFGVKEMEISHDQASQQKDVTEQARSVSATTILNTVGKPGNLHKSRFPSITASNRRQPLLLVVSKHRGHYSSHSPDNLLERGTSKRYENHAKDPTSEDWIVFEQLETDVLPTTIIIRNNSGSYALEEMKIFVSEDNEVFHEWIHIEDIMQKSNMMQHFDLEPAAVHFVLSRNIRYFRLCSMHNYGGSYTAFYEFGILGISLHSVSNMAFADTLNIGRNREIRTQPALDCIFGIDRKVKLKKNGEWIRGIVCRETVDKLCVKYYERYLLTFRWIQRDEIPSKLRFYIPNINQMSQYTFAASIGAGDGVPLFYDEFHFENLTEFAIPLDKLVCTSSTPDTVYVYTKPKGKDVCFELIKRIKLRDAELYKFAVDGGFDLVRQYAIEYPQKDFFEILATSDINIRKSGAVHVLQEKAASHDGDENGVIRLVSGGDIVNEGTLACNPSKGGTIYINANGVFENIGNIDCGKNGSVYIKCSEYKNYGKITPRPKVTYQIYKMNHILIEQLIAPGDRKNILLEVSDHRGHYLTRHPRNLLESGTGNHYDSDGGGPPNGDWMIFRKISKKLVFPASIEIRNNNGSSAVKKVSIEGSANGVSFFEWIRIENISNADRELQTFPVTPADGYFAWERAFAYFKLNVLENHGHHRYNIFYEFRINGVDEETVRRIGYDDNAVNKSNGK